MLGTRVRTITGVPAELSGRAFPSWVASPSHGCTGLWRCVSPTRESALLEVFCRAITHEHLRYRPHRSTTSFWCDPACETIDECETISRSPAAKFTKLGDASPAKERGNYFWEEGLASCHYLARHPRFQSTLRCSSVRHLVVTLGVGFLKQNRNCLFCPLAPDLPSHSELSSPGSDEHPIPARCAASWIIVDSTTIAC